MKVEAFIPDWPGPKQHAQELAAQISPFYPTVVLSDPNDYFNAQWAKARAQFNVNSDVLLWVMADVTLPKTKREEPCPLSEFFKEMESVMSRADIGWYAPSVNWTSYIYDKRNLTPVEGLDSGIYEVPNTDSLCVAIRGSVVRAMPHIDPALSFMWGMDLTAIATARLMGLKVVRDYRFKCRHPNDTGYDITKAGKGMNPVFETFSPGLRAEIAKVEAEVYDKRVEV